MGRYFSFEIEQAKGQERNPWELKKYRVFSLAMPFLSFRIRTWSDGVNCIWRNLEPETRWLGKLCIGRVAFVLSIDYFWSKWGKTYDGMMDEAVIYHKPTGSNTLETKKLTKYFPYLTHDDLEATCKGHFEMGKIEALRGV